MDNRVVRTPSLLELKIGSPTVRVHSTIFICIFLYFPLSPAFRQINRRRLYETINTSTTLYRIVIVNLISRCDNFQVVSANYIRTATMQRRYALNT